MGLVDDSIPCSSSTLIDPSDLSKEIANPDFDVWKQFNSLVMTVLISSISKVVMSLVIGHGSSAAIWRAISTAYASTSKTKGTIVKTLLKVAKEGLYEDK